MKHKLSRLGKKVKHDPLNCVLRHQFNITKKSHKTLLKRKEKDYVRIIRAKLSESFLKDPKHFWQAIKDIKNDNVNKVNLISAIDNSTWHDYFSRLYSSSNHPQSSDIESSTKPNLESSSNTELYALLNRTFTIKEIKNAISKQKTGKSTCVDMILNEMLKSSKDSIAEAIAKVFNLLLDSQLYPSLWSKNMLLSLYKGGDLDDPDNYRGIFISSCFAKLYSLGFE